MTRNSMLLTLLVLVLVAAVIVSVLFGTGKLQTFTGKREYEAFCGCGGVNGSTGVPVK